MGKNNIEEKSVCP